MIIYQTDSFGYFIEEVEARPNPRPDPEIEGDEFLIPRFCVLTAPPAVESDQIARWTGSEWTVETIAEPEPPAEPTPEELLQIWRQQTSLTDIQFALVLTLNGLMTAVEAEAWVGSGTIPPLALNAINSIEDPAVRLMARIRFAGARTIERLDPFIPLLAASVTPPLTDEQIDGLFQQGLTL